MLGQQKKKKAKRISLWGKYVIKILFVYDKLGFVCFFSKRVYTQKYNFPTCGWLWSRLNGCERALQRSSINLSKCFADKIDCQKELLTRTEKVENEIENEASWEEN